MGRISIDTQLRRPLEPHSRASLIGDGMKEKLSTVFNVSNYLISLGRSSFHLSSPGSLKPSLKSFGAVETLSSAGSLFEDISGGGQTLLSKIKGWKHSTVSTAALGEAFLSKSAKSVETVDDYLYAFDNFGLKETQPTLFIHGMGYLASVYTTIKTYMEIKDSLKEVEEGPAKDKLILIKTGKLLLSGAASSVGLIAFLTGSAYLGVLWTTLALINALFSIAEWGQTAVADPNKQDRAALQKALVAPKVITA